MLLYVIVSQKTNPLQPPCMTSFVNAPHSMLSETLEYFEFASNKFQMPKLFHSFFFVRHDQDCSHEEDYAYGVLRVELGVFKVQLKNKVQDHLEAPEHIGLAWTHPPKIKEI